MEECELHPWLGSAEAVAAAAKAVQIPLAIMGAKALLVGSDELLSEAFAILAECAAPDVAETASCAKCGAHLTHLRRGAKFCSPYCRMAYAKSVQRQKAETLPRRAGSHVGSMWRWPERERSKYAIREIGYLLCNYLRSRTHGVETPASEVLARMEVPYGLLDLEEESAAEFVARYLEAHGVIATGEEEFAELCEAARYVRGELAADDFEAA